MGCRRIAFFVSPVLMFAVPLFGAVQVDVEQATNVSATAQARATVPEAGCSSWGQPKKEPTFRVCKKLGGAEFPGLSVYAGRLGETQEPRHVVQRVVAEDGSDSFAVWRKNIPTAPGAPGSAIFVKQVATPRVVLIDACDMAWSLAIVFGEQAPGSNRENRQSFSIVNDAGTLKVKVRNGSRCQQFQTGTDPSSTGQDIDCNAEVVIPSKSDYLHVYTLDASGLQSTSEAFDLGLFPNFPDCVGAFSYPDAMTKLACSGCSSDCTQDPATFSCSDNALMTMCNQNARPFCPPPPLTLDALRALCPVPVPASGPIVPTPTPGPVVPGPTEPGIKICKKIGDDYQPGLSVYAWQGEEQKVNHVVQQALAVDGIDSFVVWRKNIPTSQTKPGAVIFVKKVSLPRVAILDLCDTQWSMAFVFRDEGGDFAIVNDQGALTVKARNAQCRFFRKGMSLEKATEFNCSDGVQLPLEVEYLNILTFDSKGSVSTSESFVPDILPHFHDCVGVFTASDDSVKSACAKCVFDCTQDPPGVRCPDKATTEMCSQRVLPFCSPPPVTADMLQALCPSMPAPMPVGPMPTPMPEPMYPGPVVPTPEPRPTPTPVVPEPTPGPVMPTPEPMLPEPIEPGPMPSPIVPWPGPVEPVVPTPEPMPIPTPVVPEPMPWPVEPTPEPILPEPIVPTPVGPLPTPTPVMPEPIPGPVVPTPEPMPTPIEPEPTEPIPLEECPMPRDMSKIPFYPVTLPHSPLTLLRVVPKNIPDGQCVRVTAKKPGISLAFGQQDVSRGLVFSFEPDYPAGGFPLDDQKLLTAAKLQDIIARARANYGLERGDFSGFFECYDRTGVIDCTDAVDVDMWACADTKSCPPCVCPEATGSGVECPPCPGIDCSNCPMPDCPEPVCPQPVCPKPVCPPCECPDLDCSKCPKQPASVCPPCPTVDSPPCTCPPGDVDCTQVKTLCDLTKICPPGGSTCKGGGSAICLNEVDLPCVNLQDQPDERLYEFIDVGTENAGDASFVPGGRLRVYTGKIGVNDKLVVGIKQRTKLERLTDKKNKRLDSHEYYPGCTASPQKNCGVFSRMVLTKKGAKEVHVGHPDPTRKGSAMDTHKCEVAPCNVDFICWKQVKNPKIPGDTIWVRCPCIEAVESVCVQK